jgi:hypothetical protein
MNELYQIDDEFGVGGVVVQDDFVVDAPPYYRFLIAKKFSDWLKRRPKYIKVTQILSSSAADLSFRIVQK